MAATEKTVSALINRQVPDFVRSDHPQFKRFVELYYQWLETDGSTNSYSYGNTIYHIMNSDKYRDIDNTLDPFVRLFKQELLPYFPEKTELDLAKILKGAREFYLKKGSEESVKWLFKALYGDDIEVFYPKKQILIASDGKWKLPKAFNLTISVENENIDPNLLERHKGMGSISKATCIIESANRTIDKTFGTEILEIYVSNVVGTFQNGEQLEISYVDQYGVSKVFSEKIVGSISNIKVDSNIKTDPQQKRRGESYNVGDPVIVYGGLDNTAQANDAVAIVGNVTVGSIEGVTPLFYGYGYRTYSNTEVVVLRSSADDPNANLSTDIRVVAINETDSTTNSQAKFVETIDVDMMPIEYLSGVVLSTANYTTFTQNNRNIVINATESNRFDIYLNYDDVWANGSSYQTANFKGKILTSNASGFGQGGASAYTGALALYSVSNTVPLTTTGFLVGQPLYTKSAPQKSFTINSITTSQLAANIDSKVMQCMNYQTLSTGGIALFNIINGGYGFRQTPSLDIQSYFDTYWSMNDTTTHSATRQPMGGYGKIAHIYITNPGTGYANGDAIVLNGYGYDFAGYVNVNTTGSIINTTITNRGEGYYGNKTVSITTSGGTSAVLTPYGFGEGSTNVIANSAIGRIKDFRVLSRGFDYISTPVVSLKVVDMVINPLSEVQNLVEGERVYQGSSLSTAIFQGIVKSYNRTTNVLRLFNYSGNSFSNFNATIPLISEGGVTITINLAAKVPPPAAVNGLGDLGDPYFTVRSTGGLPNPWFYGNGRAKGVAEFYNGLIKFPGFYLNTDGFLSADKKTQDGTVYHNFSYVIESERSLSEYQQSVKDIVHPAGTTMLGSTVTRSEMKETVQPSTAVYLNLPNNLNSTINVANSQMNVVTGINTAFTTTATLAAANDMLWIIDTLAPLRSQAKTISRVLSATSLEVFGNFTYIGQGRIATNSTNKVVVSGNTNTISQYLSTGDMLQFNIAAGNLYVAQTGTVQIFTANGKVVGSGTAFSTQLKANDYVKINNEVKQVVNIASSTVMNVNSAFSSALSSQAILKLATAVQANVTAIIGTELTLDATFNANTANLVYRICPNYAATAGYSYDIISTSNYANE